MPSGRGSNLFAIGLPVHPREFPVLVLCRRGSEDHIILRIIFSHPGHDLVTVVLSADVGLQGYIAGLLSPPDDG